MNEMTLFMLLQWRSNYMSAKDPTSATPEAKSEETIISAVGEDSLTKKYEGSYNLIS